VNRRTARRKRKQQPRGGNTPVIAAVTVMRKIPSIHSAIGPRQKRNGQVSEREEGLIKTHAGSENRIRQ
jgi:hypothetical protein